MLKVKKIKIVTRCHALSCLLTRKIYIFINFNCQTYHKIIKIKIIRNEKYYDADSLHSNI